MRGFSVVLLVAGLWAICPLSAAGFQAPPPGNPDTPNIIILFADDMGYGDTGLTGHPTIDTPNLDRMAREGMQLSQFNVAVASCRPSRASLMTGRYAARIHPTFYYSGGPSEAIPEYEFGLAEGLKQAGYATAMTGKWHLTPEPEKLGFDRLYRVERDSITTRRSTEAAVDFMRENRDGPFFFYLSYYMPHVPLRVSETFDGRSRRGQYGDTIEEIDWSVGRVLDELQTLGIAENTFVIFTSDNGPWLKKDLDGGNAGLLRGGKGTTWEGGVRVPAFTWWPGTIEAGTRTAAFVTAMDLYQTALGLAGIKAPGHLIFDGRDRRDVFVEGSGKDRDELMVYYYINKTKRRVDKIGVEELVIGHDIRAARLGPWKAHFITTETQGAPKVHHEEPLLFHLDLDPREKFDVAAEHPEVVDRIRRLVEEHVKERDAEIASFSAAR